MTYGIVGVGAIASAIVMGLCEQEDEAPSILLSPRNADMAADLAARFPTVRVAGSNQQVIDGSSVVVLCVRPQDAGAALQDLTFSERQPVVSVMAGIPIEALRRLLAPATDIARSIPLPSVAARSGMTPIYPSTEAARALFDKLGCALDVPDESAFEAVAAGTATIAAHFAYLNTISQWLTAQGIPEASARRQVASAFAGLAPELLGSSPDFEKLAQEHATPGGLNEQFVGFLREEGVFDSVRSGLDGVLRRLTRGSPARSHDNSNDTA